MSSSNSSPSSQPHQSPTPGHAATTGSHLTPAFPLMHPITHPTGHRKMASTGGGRAWSEEEENYLIETRQHKMPYKHIAAHLQKTELACRLHYHQLSFGTKRRRRTSSVSSIRSQSSTISAETTLLMQRPLPTLSPPASPENTPRHSARSQSPIAPVSILPKPLAGPQAMNLQPSNALRLITQDIERFEERSRINKDRLARIYDAHRVHFWATVARDYGDNVSPTVLEDVWRRGFSGNFPPTPPQNCSPSAERQTLAPAFIECPQPMAGGFNPVNLPRPMLPTPNPSRPGSFAIASLLTENREVRRSASVGVL